MNGSEIEHFMNDLALAKKSLSEEDKAKISWWMRSQAFAMIQDEYPELRKRKHFYRFCRYLEEVLPDFEEDMPFFQILDRFLHQKSISAQEKDFLSQAFAFNCVFLEEQKRMTQGEMSKVKQIGQVLIDFE